MLIFGEAELQGRNGVTVRAFPILDGQTRVGTFWHVQADDALADPLGMLEMGKRETVGTLQKSAVLGFAERRLDRNRTEQWRTWLELLRSGQMPEADFQAFMREDAAFAAWARAQTAAAQ